MHCSCSVPGPQELGRRRGILVDACDDFAHGCDVYEEQVSWMVRFDTLVPRRRWVEDGG